MKLFTSTGPNLPQLQKASSNNARVGSYILPTTIFENCTHLFIPKQEGKPTERMLYLFRRPYPENSNISELLQHIPSWMSAFFWKGPNGEEQVTVSQGLLLPRNSWEHFQGEKPLTHTSIPLYTLIKNKAGDSLEINLPSGVRYSYGTGQPSEVSWGRTSPFKKSFAQIEFPKDDLNAYNLKIQTPTPNQPSRRECPPRYAHVISFNPDDPESPILYHADSYLGPVVFPKTVKKALEYFGIPNTATYAGYLNHFRST
jgi:hypothetical protein